MDETSNAQRSYSIVPITANDIQTVAAFLKKFFFRDEPLNVAIGLLEETDSAIKLENYCIGCLKYGKLTTCEFQNVSLDRFAMCRITN